MSGSADNPLVLDDSEEDQAIMYGTSTLINLFSPSPARADASPSFPPPSPVASSPQSLVVVSPLRDLSLRPATPERAIKRGSVSPGGNMSGAESLAATSSTPSIGASPEPGHGGDVAMDEEDDVLMEEDEPRDEEMEDGKSLALPAHHAREGLSDDPDSQESLAQTIGSSSPLLIRLKEQRSRRRGSARRFPPPEEEVEDENALYTKMEKFLVGFEQKMTSDHATTVRWILHDANKPIENADSKFMDKVSPFASMPAVHILPSATVPDGETAIRMETFTNKKHRMGKSKTLLATKTIKSETPRVPKYNYNTTVKRNILSMDDEKLRFIPYMGDAEESKKKNARLIQDLEQAYNPKNCPSGRDSEWSSQVRGYLDRYLEGSGLGVTQDMLTHYLLDTLKDSSECDKREVQTILESFDSPLAPHEITRARMFSHAFNKVHDYPLRESMLPVARLRELAEQLRRPSDDKLMRTPQKIQNQLNSDRGIPPTEPAWERLGTYTTLTCLICGAMSCPTHGDSTSDEIAPGYHQFVHQPLVTTYQDILRKQDERAAKNPASADSGIVDTTACSPDCYLIAGDKSGYEISPEDLAKIEDMVVSLREKKRRACTISFFVDHPCWMVHNAIQQMAPRTVEPPLPGRSKQPDWYNNQKKTLKWDWQDQTPAHLHQERSQANPCEHDGPCSKGCPCFEANLLCESICGCSDDCPRKFTGCGCHSAGLACVSDSCICVQMNRECGPQCSSCGAKVRLNPDDRYDDELFATGCQNIHLQRGVACKVVLGESQLEGVGFGLYVGEPVRKGAFLSEYAGEVISFSESERRGIIYDRKFASFLFDLNHEWTIDAARLGNKSRFINHADNDKDGLNCEAKIVLVNGEHRIKFLALRDIKAGEELLFNYGKKFADKHGLNKKLPKAATEGGKRGVVVGEEALEALDGLNPANRARRGKMTAIRGGHGGGRGSGRKASKVAAGSGSGKARKAAPPVVSEPADVEEPVQEDPFSGPHDDDDDDYEDEDVREVRKKRKIVRPMRYTR